MATLRLLGSDPSVIRTARGESMLIDLDSAAYAQPAPLEVEFPLEASYPAPRHRHDGADAHEDRVMATPLSISTERRGEGALVLTAAGEIDLTNIDAFVAALDDAASARNDTTVAVDLGGVQYLDSGGINVCSPTPTTLT